MEPTRRGILAGLVGFVACAPAIVRVSSLMPVRSFDELTHWTAPNTLGLGLAKYHVPWSGIKSWWEQEYASELEELSGANWFHA